MNLPKCFFANGLHCGIKKNGKGPALYSETMYCGRRVLQKYFQGCSCDCFTEKYKNIKFPQSLRIQVNANVARVKEKLVMQEKNMRVGCGSIKCKTRKIFLVASTGVIGQHSADA